VRDLATPGSAMILTSVRRLHELPGVNWVQIAGLTEPEAREFFRRTIGAARADAEPEQVEVLLEHLSRLPAPIRVAGGKLGSRPDWTIEMFLLKMRREAESADALPSDCAAMLAPMIAADQDLTDPERHLLRCFARQGTEVIDYHEAARMSGADPGESERVLARGRPLPVDAVRARLLRDAHTGAGQLRGEARRSARDRAASFLPP
jgi:hypothetical protein